MRAPLSTPPRFEVLSDRRRVGPTPIALWLERRRGEGHAYAIVFGVGAEACRAALTACQKIAATAPVMVSDSTGYTRQIERMAKLAEPGRPGDDRFELRVWLDFDVSGLPPFAEGIIEDGEGRLYLYAA